LRGRGTDDEDSVKKRLEQADKEMAFAEEDGAHDKIVVNDDLDTGIVDELGATNSSTLIRQMEVC